MTQASVQSWHELAVGHTEELVTPQSSAVTAASADCLSGINFFFFYKNREVCTRILIITAALHMPVFGFLIRSSHRFTYYHLCMATKLSQIAAVCLT